MVQADAKFDAFNDLPVKDVMAVFPQEATGGCVASSAHAYGWTWLQNDVWGGGAATALAGFQVDRYLGPVDGSGNYINNQARTREKQGWGEERVVGWGGWVGGWVGVGGLAASPTHS